MDAPIADAGLLGSITELDCKLVELGRGLRLLAHLSWPARSQEEFLVRWRRGERVLPQISYQVTDYSEQDKGLAALELRAAALGTHPLVEYLRRTAQCLRLEIDLLHGIGTARVTDRSIELFGRPGDELPGSSQTNIDAARHFIAVAEEFGPEIRQTEEVLQISAADMRDQLQREVDGFFVDDPVRVELDPELLAKAAAGPTRIRLRESATFDQYDREQLLQHEAFVHTLTSINGRMQPHLPSLGMATPRITATQEGLATFAELMTGAIDLKRMKRISLRILAIDKALHGADFLDVFEFFLEAGQDQGESFISAQRVFRGVPLTGGEAFTKDAVYLHGLLSVHTFFRWAMKNGRFNLCRALFAGKMNLHDAIALEPWFESGWIKGPRYLPVWVQRSGGLAGRLAFSLMANRIALDKVVVEDLVLAL